MAHVIGYVGQVSEEMLQQPQWELYNPGDIVGMSGLEAYYNDILMGKNGSRQVLVNSRGKEVGTLSDVPAVPGKRYAPPSISICRLRRKRRWAIARAPSWPWTRAMAKCWPWSAARPSIPTNSPSTLRATNGATWSMTPASRCSTRPFRRSLRPARSSRSSWRRPVCRKASRRT